MLIIHFQNLKSTLLSISLLTYWPYNSCPTAYTFRELYFHLGCCIYLTSYSILSNWRFHYIRINAVKFQHESPILQPRFLWHFSATSIVVSSMLLKKYTSFHLYATNNTILKHEKNYRTTR